MPYKPLLKSLKQHAGRDKTGRISVRHRKGRKILYRKISTLEQFPNTSGKVVTIEYDPNRSADIALLELESGSKIYILAPDGLKKGDKLCGGEKVEVKLGNRMKLKNIPTGTEIHDIELVPGGGNKLVKSAGSRASLMAKEGNYVQIKLPSGELRKVHAEGYGSIGRVSNPRHSLKKLKKAGIIYKLGRRPSVRGKAMSPRAHPHGGGEGVSPIGLKYPKTPWGKPARGVRTRRSKPSDKFIVQRRK